MKEAPEPGLTPSPPGSECLASPGRGGCDERSTSRPRTLILDHPERFLRERLGERSMSIPDVSGRHEPLNQAVSEEPCDPERRIRDSNPCRRRERAVS